MKTKITRNNQDRIAAELRKVNGQRDLHVYSHYGQIESLAHTAECTLEIMGLPKKDRAGAQYSATSGDPVSNSYNWSRIGTYVTLTRTSTGWFLTTVDIRTVWKEGGKTKLWLTPEQDTIAVSKLREQYEVI